MRASIISNGNEGLEQGTWLRGRHGFETRGRSRERVDEAFFNEPSGLTNDADVVEVRTSHLDQCEKLDPYGTKEAFLEFGPKREMSRPDRGTIVEDVLVVE